MLNSTRTGIVASFFAVLALPSYADNAEARQIEEQVLQIVEECNQTTGNTNSQRSAIFGLLKQAQDNDLISELSNLFSADETLRCVNIGRDRNVALNLSTGSYMFADLLLEQINRLLAEDDRAIQEEHEALLRQEHEQELFRRTLSACFDLAETNQTAAYTNSICQSIFLVSMPNWPKQ
jgi:hypothetical protein